MNGLIIKCEALYFVTFRKPTSTSLILSYPVPPFTTIRGMIANAMGQQQHDYSLQEKIKIGLRVKGSGFKNVEMAKILKFKESSRPSKTAYPSAPMFKEFIVMPEYEIFIAGEKELIMEIHTALIVPKRPLYLGQSDDLINLNISEFLDIQGKEVDKFHTIMEGTHPGCAIERVPFAFHQVKGRYTLEYKTISIPLNGDVIESHGIAHDFDGLNVFLF